MAQLNLYCAEDGWDEEEDYQEESFSYSSHAPSLPPPLHNLSCTLVDEQLFSEHHELVSLSTKEKAQKKLGRDYLESLRTDPVLACARREAVEWILSVNVHYNFTAHTAALSVNFLDRFLSSFHFQREKPWMTQLAAVACLSLAAKVEETQVPLLLDLQVEEAQYVFEAKTIQRMELLILSSLEWKMHPVTPLSFIDHIIRRLGMRTHQHWEFFRRCERLLLSLITGVYMDSYLYSRFTCYMPSIVASSIMLYVINQLEPFNPMEYENQLLGVMEISKEDVKDCLQLIKDTSMVGRQKRKSPSEPGSPKGVFDASFNSDGTNDSWVSSSASSSSSSSPMGLQVNASKKSRIDDRHQISPFNHVFVDIFPSP
ncbi:Cyclin-D3-1 [Nymphaea thermarum]|nr:Cyclin-D3-1 [Nymphaea thermarum]